MLTVKSYFRNRFFVKISQEVIIRACTQGRPIESGSSQCMGYTKTQQQYAMKILLCLFSKVNVLIPWGVSTFQYMDEPSALNYRAWRKLPSEFVLQFRWYSLLGKVMKPLSILSSLYENSWMLPLDSLLTLVSIIYGIREIILS